MNYSLTPNIKQFLLIFVISFLFFSTSFAFSENLKDEPDFKKSLKITTSEINYKEGKTYNHLSCMGKIKNNSNLKWSSIIIEVNFFNENKKLIDTITENIYDLTIQPNDEVTFRVTGYPSKKASEYVTHEARITDAYSPKKCKSKKKGSTLSNFLMEFAVPILLIILMISLIIASRRKGSPQNKIIDLNKESQKLIKEQNDIIRETQKLMKEQNDILNSILRGLVDTVKKKN